jgi:speckle-type POZ protein
VSLGRDITALLDSGTGLDVAFSVAGQVYNAHRLILSARSPMFRAMLGGPLKEGADAVIDIPDIQPPVFAALLHFAYADELPEALSGDNLDVPMAQHLLAAADRFQIERLRSFCEQRLCTSVDVETVATTLALAETNHATELKRVCLDFVADNLQAVMTSEGFGYLIRTCPHLQMEILRACALASDGVAPGLRSPGDAEEPGGRESETPVPGLPGSLQRKATRSFERRVKPRRSLPGAGGAPFYLPPPPPPPGTA